MSPDFTTYIYLHAPHGFVLLLIRVILVTFIVSGNVIGLNFAKQYHSQCFGLKYAIFHGEGFCSPLIGMSFLGVSVHSETLLYLMCLAVRS